MFSLLKRKSEPPLKDSPTKSGPSVYAAGATGADPAGPAESILTGLMTRYSETLDYKTALEWALPELLKQVNAEAGTFFLARPESSDLECVASVGPVNIHGIKVPNTKGLVGQAYSNTQSILIEDAQNDSRHNRQVDEATGFKTRSILTVPVHFSGKVYGALQALNRITENGKSEFFNSNHLKVFEDAALALGLALHNLSLTQSIVKNELIQKDLRAAEETQKALYSAGEKIPFVAARVVPARNLSGDFVDVVSVGDSVFMCQGDVAGKGIPASLTVARCLALFRLLVKDQRSLSEIVSVMNQELYELSERLEGSVGFVTFFVACLDPNQLKLSFINAGHGDLLLMERGKSDIVFSSSAPPLGIVESAEFEFDVQSVELLGKRLCVFTDGVSEAHSGEDELGLAGVSAIQGLMLDIGLHEALDRTMQFFTEHRLKTADDATMLLVGQ